MLEKDEVIKKIDINEIKELIPHRYPFLFIDYLENVKLGESAVGVKCVTSNENFFPGHFPGYPVMPGVIIIEAMAQTSGVLVSKTLKETDENFRNNIDKLIVYFASIEEVKFRNKVLPGDKLYIHVKILRNKLSFWKFEATAFVDEVKVAEGIFSASVTFKD